VRRKIKKCRGKEGHPTGGRGKGREPIDCRGTDVGAGILQGLYRQNAIAKRRQGTKLLGEGSEKEGKRGQLRGHLNAVWFKST